MRPQRWISSNWLGNKHWNGWPAIVRKITTRWDIWGQIELDRNMRGGHIVTAFCMVFIKVSVDGGWEQGSRRTLAGTWRQLLERAGVLAFPVSPQINFSLEPFLAEAAGKRLVAGVFSHVSDQVAALREGLRTNYALVGLLSWKEQKWNFVDTAANSKQLVVSPYLCEYMCVSSCQTSGEIFFHKMSKDRAGCPSGWAGGSTGCCSSWKSFHTGDTWTAAPACRPLSVLWSSMLDTEFGFPDGTGWRGERLGNHRRNIALRPTPGNGRIFHSQIDRNISITKHLNQRANQQTIIDTGGNLTWLLSLTTA